MKWVLMSSLNLRWSGNGPGIWVKAGSGADRGIGLRAPFPPLPWTCQQGELVLPITAGFLCRWQLTSETAKLRGVASLSAVSESGEGVWRNQTIGIIYIWYTVTPLFHFYNKG